MKFISTSLVFIFSIIYCALTNPIDAAEIRSHIVQGRDVINVKGKIDADDDKVFEQAARGLSDVTVVLHSSGGAIVAGINIGKAIRKRGFTTIVLKNGVCLSACAMIWLGGTRRILHPQAALGFHAAYILKKGKRLENGVANAWVGAYYNSLGLSDQAIGVLSVAPPSKILRLDAQKLTALGIAVESVGRMATNGRKRVMKPKPSFSNMRILKNIDYPGGDYLSFRGDLRECLDACSTESRCFAFSWVRRNKTCWLKDELMERLPNRGITSGTKLHTSRVNQTARNEFYFEPEYGESDQSDCLTPFDWVTCR